MTIVGERETAAEQWTRILPSFAADVIIVAALSQISSMDEEISSNNARRL